MKKCKIFLLSFIIASVACFASGCYFGPFFEITSDGEFSVDSAFMDGFTTNGESSTDKTSSSS